MTILVINPGSTSTKVALYQDEKEVWRASASHTVADLAHFSSLNDQYNYRLNLITHLLKEALIPLQFDAVIGRGGLLRPLPGGVYSVNEAMKLDLLHASMEHPCNLGALLAAELAVHSGGCPAFIADPVVIDEMQSLARYTGLPELSRKSVFHALNTKAIARKYAYSQGSCYENMNLIVAHLGGGISVSANRKGRVIDVNNALDGEGAFTPERAGTLPAGQLAELCFSGKYSLSQIKKKLTGQGGLVAYLGTTDLPFIIKKAEAGESPYKEVLDAMLYGVSKQIGAMAAALCGEVDAILLTGGIAYNPYCTNFLSASTSFIAPVVVLAGEDEMGALAFNAHKVLIGELALQHYSSIEEAGKKTLLSDKT
ncbi:MAG: butyrate kinase [Phocaeicola sp.]